MHRFGGKIFPVVPQQQRRLEDGVHLLDRHALETSNEIICVWMIFGKQQIPSKNTQQRELEDNLVKKHTPTGTVN